MATATTTNTKAETKTPPPETPPDPPANPQPAAVAPVPEEAKKVTAAELVADDKDVFPPSRDEHREINPGEEEPRPKHPGGRPKGVKDSYKRGRPQRKDWADEPMRKQPKKLPDEPDYDPELDGPDEEEEKAKKPQAVPPNYGALAQFAVDSITGALTGALGEHWRPSPSPAAGIPSERENLIQCLSRYLEENKISDVPPGIMLALCVGMYATPRIVLTIRMRRAAAPRKSAAPPAPMRDSAGVPVDPQPAVVTPPAPENAPESGRPGSGKPSADFGPSEPETAP